MDELAPSSSSSAPPEASSGTTATGRTKREAILALMGELGELTPGEIGRRLGFAPPTVSYHLDVLLGEGRVTRRRASSQRLYSLLVEQPGEVQPLRPRVLVYVVPDAAALVRFGERVPALAAASASELAALPAAGWPAAIGSA